MSILAGYITVSRVKVFMITKHGGVLDGISLDILPLSTATTDQQRSHPTCVISYRTPHKYVSDYTE